MKHSEPQSIAIEVDCRRRVSDWKRRDRLPETCQSGHLQIYSEAKRPSWQAMNPAHARIVGEGEVR
jgi:hypothetical protein